MIVKPMKKWHEYVCRDGVCWSCGIEYQPNQLAGHHMKGRRSHPELKFETDNGFCTCDTPSAYNDFTGCHKAIEYKILKITKDENGQYCTERVRNKHRSNVNQQGLAGEKIRDEGI